MESVIPYPKRFIVGVLTVKTDGYSIR